MDTESLTIDAEEQAMRDLGHETDVAQNRPVDDTPQETAQERPVDPDVAPQPDAPASSPESPEPTRPEVPEPRRDAPQQRPRDPATGKFQKDGRTDTEYSRAQKEQDRRERSWQALQAEKEQFRQMTTQWQEQQRMAQLEAARQQNQPIKKDGLTAQEYYQGAKVFERDGDYENAYKAHQVAQELYQQEQQRVQQMKGVEAEYQWRTQMQQAISMEPQIANPDSPISQHLGRIIEQNPWIYHVPNGFMRAAEVAHMLTQQGRMKELEDELIAVKAENEKYRRKSQPGRGGYASPRTTDKDFDDMSLEEMESHLKGMTAEADNYR